MPRWVHKASSTVRNIEPHSAKRWSASWCPGKPGFPADRVWRRRRWCQVNCEICVSFGSPVAQPDVFSTHVAPSESAARCQPRAWSTV